MRGNWPGIDASSARRPAAASATPASTAGQRQKQRFDHRLPREPVAASAQRASDRHVAGPRGGACEQQVGDIAARDQQHEADGAQKHLQQRPQIRDEKVLEPERSIVRVPFGACSGFSVWNC